MTVSPLATSVITCGIARPPVPESGQVVEVWGSTWAVAEVQEQGLPRNPADEGSSGGFQHAVTLQALDEDWLGEELTVVRELEVGHTVSPAQGCRNGPAQTVLTIRTCAPVSSTRCVGGAATSADKHQIQLPFHSGVRVEAYQMEPPWRVFDHRQRAA